MTTPSAGTDASAKARGLLLGAALGDALGAPFEGQDTVDGAGLLLQERSSETLRYTDDTAQTLVVAQHLAGHAGVDEDALAHALARAWEQEPWRGYGAGSRQVLQRVRAGVGWGEAARACFSGRGSYGNGAAMRVAPVALTVTSLQHAAQLARRTAKTTHAHRDGEQGAALQACAAFLALHSDPAQPLDREHVLDQLARAIEGTHWHARLDRIRLMSHSVSPSYAAARLGNDAAALNSVPMALHAFLQDPDRPPEALRYSLRAGGDTDTIASMTGALAGARCGVRALPVAWLERLENAARMSDLGDELAARILRGL